MRSRIIYHGCDDGHVARREKPRTIDHDRKSGQLVVYHGSQTEWNEIARTGTYGCHHHVVIITVSCHVKRPMHRLLCPTGKDVTVCREGREEWGLQLELGVPITITLSTARIRTRADT